MGVTIGIYVLILIIKYGIEKALAHLVVYLGVQTNIQIAEQHAQCVVANRGSQRCARRCAGCAATSVTVCHPAHQWRLASPVLAMPP